MKKFIPLVSFLLSYFLGQSQSLDSPEPTAVIKFYINTNRIEVGKSIPFDKPFIIQIDSFPVQEVDDIDSIMVLKVAYYNGRRDLKSTGGSNARNDIVLKQGPDGYQLKNSVLSIFMPAIKPNKDFDILIQTKLSQTNLERAYQLNNYFNQNRAAVAFNNVPQLNDIFNTLKDATNNSNYATKRLLIPFTTLQVYYNTVYAPLDEIYRYVDSIHLRNCDALTDADIASFAKSLCSECVSGLTINRVENVIIRNQFPQLYRGLLKLDNKSISDVTLATNFEERINNMDSWIKYFDSMLVVINELHAVSPFEYSPLETKIRSILNCLAQNKTILAPFSDRVKNHILNNTSQAIWLIGSDKANDLQTKGSSIFTVDAGVANIWARDVDKKNVSIPKVYVGLNIYFRSFNKNVRLKTLPHDIKSLDYRGDNKLLARLNIFHYVGLMVGFTVGSIDKPNFSNLSSGTSLLLGPSLKLGALRLSGGGSLLQRADVNPLITTKKAVIGAYASLSLDFDLLQGVQKATSFFFK